ncbi:MAG: methyltransferase domain-containing protein [Acidobacteria bacterium]|nr:methyltransferase domain-containing protein [Acidobacteriota bacterium]
MLLRAKIKKLPVPVLQAMWTVTHLGKKHPDLDMYQAALKGKRGIEVGGPSFLFMTMLPLYQIVAQLDGANFSNDTLWEGRLQDGGKYNYFRDRSGTQFVAEATSLAQIESESYDFVISSNCLEHVANPKKAIEEWKRVIKNGGYLVVVVPRKEGSFDHRRPVTTLAHLNDDFRNDVREDDMTHLDEILELHDLSKDWPAGTPDEFKSRSLKNFNNRALHHHVFDKGLLNDILRESGLNVVNVYEDNTNIFALSEVERVDSEADRGVG